MLYILYVCFLEDSLAWYHYILRLWEVLHLKTYLALFDPIFLTFIWSWNQFLLKTALISHRGKLTDYGQRPLGWMLGRQKSTGAPRSPLPIQVHSFSYVLSFSTGHHMGWNLRVTSDTSLCPAPTFQTDASPFDSPASQGRTCLLAPSFLPLLTRSPIPRMPSHCMSAWLIPQVLKASSRTKLLAWEESD